jgi:hypothetical protein
MIFFIRIFVAQGWYIGTLCLILRNNNLTVFAVAYSLGIYLLNLFLAFLQPKFDPSNEAIDNEHPASPRNKMRNFAPSSAVFLNLSSGIRPPEPSLSDLPALGSRSLMFRCFGQCWWFIG